MFYDIIHRLFIVAKWGSLAVAILCVAAVVICLIFDEEAPVEGEKAESPDPDVKHG